MNANALAAAHRTLPFGTQVRVENLGSSPIENAAMEIFVGGRVIDVTRGAAVQLGMISSGTARVRVSVLSGGRQLSGCT